MKTKKVKIDEHPKFIYEKEDDILNIWLSDKHIDYAEMEGNVIVHFSPKNEPVYIEILHAADFLREQAASLPKDVRQAINSS